MTLGSMNHLSLTVSHLEQSERFYDTVLGFMGYQKVEKTEELVLWWSKTAGAIGISPANPESPNKTHDRYSPGLHHFAFNAESRAQVNELHQVLVNNNITILDPPAEYQYSPGYYALFFADPDGIKLEFVHMPEIPE